LPILPCAEKLELVLSTAPCVEWDVKAYTLTHSVARSREGLRFEPRLSAEPLYKCTYCDTVHGVKE